MSEVRVTIVDDHPVFRIGMATLLDSLDGMIVVGQAASAAAGRSCCWGSTAPTSYSWILISATGPASI